MSKKRILFFAVMALVLAALVYLQVRAWRRFDWETFGDQTANVNWLLICGSVFFVYAADTVRAWRWALLLRPSKKVSGASLIAPQFIGFAGLALLGRPGELIRPYIIGRRVGLPLSSQMAVWTVERIFDFGTVTLFLLLDILFSSSLRELPVYHAVRTGGFLLGGLVLLGIATAILLGSFGAPISNRIERTFSPRFPEFAGRLCLRIREFSNGLNSIQDARSFVYCTLMSIMVWGGVALSYRLVTFAYRDPQVSQLDIPQVILLMFGSIAGGVLQLPVIGGGSQFATISIMQNVFDITPELATSCGIMLWLVTFMSVTPVGLLLARRERISLTQLAAAEEEASLHNPSAAVAE